LQGLIGSESLFPLKLLLGFIAPSTQDDVSESGGIQVLKVWGGLMRTSNIDIKDLKSTFSPMDPLSFSYFGPV
jgi:hypothetical protein